MDRGKFLYEPRPQFVGFHRRTKRWACIVAHRRAGKTVAAINDLIAGALECKRPRPRLAYVAPFRDQAKRVAWDYLKFYSAPFAAGKPNESELSVPMPNEGKIMLFGADNPDALRGIYLDAAVLDEFGDFRPSVWGNVIRPTLSDRLGWVVFGGTPKGRNEFWQVREMARQNKDDEWMLVEVRASESGIIDPRELERLKTQLSPEQYAQEYETDFTAALPGAYYGREMVAAEREGRIGEVPHDPSIPVYTAWDIGYRDDTAIWWFQVLRGEIHLIEHHASSGQSIKFYTDLVASKGYKYAIHWLPHDAKAKTLAAQGKSVIEQLGEGLGLLNMRIVPNLDIQDGIQAARVALRRCWFDEECCAEGLEALRQYQREYDDDKKAFRERPRHDWTSHAADAFRMMAVAWAEEVQPEAKHEPMRGLLVGPENTVSLNEMWRAVRPPSGRI